MFILSGDIPWKVIRQTLNPRPCPASCKANAEFVKLKYEKMKENAAWRENKLYMKGFHNAAAQLLQNLNLKSLT